VCERESVCERETERETERQRERERPFRALAVAAQTKGNDMQRLARWRAADGRGQEATFKLPTGIATDTAKNIYVADEGDNRIRRISCHTNTVATLAGAGRAGLVDGPGTTARFNQPCALAIWRSTLLVADRANNAIRAVNMSDAHVSLLAGQSSC